MKFYKKKSFYIILVIGIIIVGGVAYSKIKKANQPTEYETVEVKKGEVFRTVDATGKVQSASDLSLRFEVAGTVANIKVTESQQVKQGELLTNLNLAELNSTVAKASADLNARLAGSTKEELNSLKASANNYKASWDKAKADSDSAIATAGSGLKTAEANLKLAEGGSKSKIVTSEYEDTVALLQKTISILDDALTQSDNILGIDNSFANDEFEKYLSSSNVSALQIAKNYYSVAKKTKITASSVVIPLTTFSSQTDIDSALIQTETALSNMNQLLSLVKTVLDNTNPVGDLTQAELDTKKSTITTVRSTLTTQYSSLLTQKQSVINAKNSYATYKITYDTAFANVSIVKQQQVANIKSKEASYNQVYATYQNALNPPREVDVASLRASLSQAVANRNKAVLNAPMDGLITKVNRKLGEYISASDAMIQMSSPNYEIEIDVPETDVAKVAIGNTVGYTLDAFGDSYKLKGKVYSIDPKSTEIQDVVYYKVKIAIAKEDISGNEISQTIKPGMTANVVINTDPNGLFKNVVYLPSRAVLTKSDNSKYVRILFDNKVKEVTVDLGSRVDNGLVVIKSGLKEKEIAVLSIKE